MKIVFGLGANLGNRHNTLDKVVCLLGQHIGNVLGRSKWYETEPLLHPETPTLNQEKFLNGSILVDTSKDFEEIIEIVWEIEKRLGRKRKEELVRWGPRVIDIDLIAAEGLIYNSSNLKIPHPEMPKREFVLQPMSEICSNWVHPVLKKTVIEMLEDLRVKG